MPTPRVGRGASRRTQPQRRRGRHTGVEFPSSAPARHRVAAIAVVAAAATALGTWLALQPVEPCLLLMSLPPQGACRSHLGATTPLGPGASGLTVAAFTGVTVGTCTWLAGLGPPWRARALLGAIVVVAVGTLALPVACEWVIAGERMHRTPSASAAGASPASRPPRARRSRPRGLLPPARSRSRSPGSSATCGRARDDLRGGAERRATQAGRPGGSRPSRAPPWATATPDGETRRPTPTSDTDPTRRTAPASVSPARGLPPAPAHDRSSDAVSSSSSRRAAARSSS